MRTVTVGAILQKEAQQALGHLLYVVRYGGLFFYVAQSRRDVVSRFWEHLQAPSKLGQLISLNAPGSHEWSVDFYALADCAAFVQQKSLFALQEWQFTAKKPDGTGLGLWVSKTLVERYGGKITMEAVRPHGTGFVVWLRCEPLAA